MTMHPDGARIKLDKRALARKAAQAVLHDGVTKQDAMARFRIGLTRLRQAIAELRAERATGGRP